MEKFLSKLTLKQKMRFGFGAIWIVLAVITIQAVVNLYIVRTNITEVVEVKQPIALDASKMLNSLQKAMNQLSFYMLTGEKQFLVDYQAEYTHAVSVLNAMEPKLEASQSKELAKAKASLKKFPAIVDQVENMTNKRSLKYPAFKFVDENMSGKAKIIQQQINLMLDSELNDLSADRQTMLLTLLKLQNSWLNVMSSLRGYVAFRTAAMSSNVDNYLNEVENSLIKITEEKNLELTLEEEEGVGILLESYTEYREDFMRLQEIHQGPKWRMDIWVMKNQLAPLYNDVERLVIKIKEQAVADMVNTSTDVADSTLRNLILLLSLSLLGQIIGMIVSKKVTTSVTKPVDKIVEAMKGIAQGEGDLTRRLTVKGKDELADLARFFNIFIERIQHTLRDVTQTVHDLERSSQDLMAVTHSTKEGVIKQVQVSEILSASMSTMEQKAKEVEDHSNNTSLATTQAVSRVKEGGEVVSGAAETIQEVSDGMEEITRAVVQLNDDSQTISTVINVIREIADQTNLLALNAAIEAARAGEQGRGFAVVADEVRSLAQRTQESTLEIERVIDKIRSATDATVDVVSQGQKTTKLGYDAVMKAQKVLNPVVILIDDINSMNNEMLSSAQSQNNLVQDVNLQINEIHDISEKTVEETGNTENSAMQLQQIADKLENLVKQFKI